MSVFVRAALLSALLVAASSVAACGGGDDYEDSDEAVGSETEEAQVEAQPDVSPFAGTAVEAVEAFDVDDVDAGIARLNDVIAADATELSDLEPLLDEADDAQRWAALYIVAFMAETDEDGELLAPVLDDEDLALRVIAAGSLFSLGNADAFPALVQGIDSDELLPFSDPPRPVSALAAEALEYYTGESFSTASEWEDWWDENGNSLEWDGEMYVAQ